MRYFLDISYKGTQYHGWQVQDNANSVQAELNRALELILKHTVETTGSGRTDTGVHAIKQFVHFDSNVRLTKKVHLYKFNKVLPRDISVNAIYVVPDTAHARFDAISRGYRYRISRSKNPFTDGLVTDNPLPYNREALQQMAAEMPLHTDFECFSKLNGNSKGFNCTIFESRWEFTDTEWVYYVKANRFLRGMVRAIVGTMLELAREKNDENINSLSEFKQVIASKNRKFAGSSAPAEGLYLTEVHYPSELALVEIPEE